MFLFKICIKVSKHVNNCGATMREWDEFMIVIAVYACKYILIIVILLLQLYIPLQILPRRSTHTVLVEVFLTIVLFL